MTDEFYLELSVEEFVVAIGIVKKPEEAKGLLINTLGLMSPDEEKGRLLAAYNSLFAHRLLVFGQSEAFLQPDLKKMLDIFFDSRKLIKTGKSVGVGEDLVSYYFYHNAWLEHSIIQGIVHRFQYPINNKVAQQNIEKFFSPHSSSLEGEEKKTIEISTDIFLNLKTGSFSNSDNLLSFLEKTSDDTFPEMKCLAEDIVFGDWRGSTIWIDRPNDEQLLSRGYLWVQGKERLWFINSLNADKSNFLQATLCDERDFTIHLKNLIETQ